MAEIKEQFQSVMSAPLPHFVAAMVVAGAIWGAMEWRYGGVIDRLEIENRQIEADHKNKIQDLEKLLERAREVAAPPFPSAQMTFVTEYKSGWPPRAGVPVEFDIGILNAGPSLARRANYSIALVKTKKIQMYNVIDRAFQALESDLVISNRWRPRDLAANGTYYQMINLVLSSEEVREFDAGDLLLFAINKWAWTDTVGEHSGESCHLLQHDTVSASATLAEAGPCRNHNFLR